jgi:3-phytase
VRIYAIDAARTLSEIAASRVFENEAGDFAAPMGIALFKRADGAVFAIVGRKSGPNEGYLWQYRIEPGPSLRLVRRFGKFSGMGEIEAVAVDDALGFVYYADGTYQLSADRVVRKVSDHPVHRSSGGGE